MNVGSLEILVQNRKKGSETENASLQNIGDPMVAVLPKEATFPWTPLSAIEFPSWNSTSHGKNPCDGKNGRDRFRLGYFERIR